MNPFGLSGDWMPKFNEHDLVAVETNDEMAVGVIKYHNAAGYMVDFYHPSFAGYIDESKIIKLNPKNIYKLLNNHAKD